jgi:hypothetical protein
MTEKLNDFTWHLEFHRDNADGTRTLTQRTTVPEATVEQVIDKANSLLRGSALALGNANVCVIKHQDGTVLREVELRKGE